MRKERFVFLVLFICLMMAAGVAWHPTKAVAAEEGAVGKSVKHLMVDRLVLSGKIEVDASYVDMEYLDDEEDAGNDITTATAQFEILATINENTHGNIVLLWEDDSNNVLNTDSANITKSRRNSGQSVFVEEAYITLGEFMGSSYLLGYLIIPFGNYETFFVTDPLTKQLGESHENVVMLQYAFKDAFKASVGAFNGDSDKEYSQDHIEDVFGSLEVTFDDKFTFGGSVITDISDTDYSVIGLNTYTDRTAGWSAFTSLYFDPITIVGEFMTAMSDFDEKDLDVNLDGTGDQPSAWNIEVAAEIGDKLVIALCYAGTREMDNMPESLYGGIVNYEIFDETTLSFEALLASYDDEFSSANLDEFVKGTMAVTIEF